MDEYSDGQMMEDDGGQFPINFTLRNLFFILTFEIYVRIFEDLILNVLSLDSQMQDMNGMQGYIDEDGNMVYVDGDMMGSDGDMDEYGHEGSPGGDVSLTFSQSLNDF